MNYTTLRKELQLLKQIIELQIEEYQAVDEAYIANYKKVRDLLLNDMDSKEEQETQENLNHYENY